MRRFVFRRLAARIAGFHIDSDPFPGEALPISLRSHPSDWKEAAFVTAAVAAGVASCPHHASRPTVGHQAHPAVGGGV